MKKVLLVLIMTLAIGGVNGQTIDNINLLNTRGLHGTARYTAMGGAFTALGNDLSAIHINPAAAAVFRQGTAGVSFGFQNQYDETSFLEAKNESSNFRFLFENAGFVSSFGKAKTPFVLSVTANKIADFNSNFSVTGVNRFDANTRTGITLGEYWLDGASGMDGVRGLDVFQMEDQGFLQEASATDALVIATDTDGVAFGLEYAFDDASDVSYVFEERGYSDEIQISLGSRLSDRLFYGLSLGFPYMNYSTRSVIKESGFSDSSYTHSYSLNQFNEVRANGFNIKLGIILKPLQMLRIGASYQSPTWYGVREYYSFRVDGFSANGTVSGYEYAFDDINYGLTTPAIYRAGAALVLLRSLVVSLDYEYTDARNINLTSRDAYNYLEAEQDYINVANASQTLKAGAELRIGQVFLRGGARYRQSNFNEPDYFISDDWNYSAGLGFANKDFSLDLAYTLNRYTRNFYVHPFLEDDNNPSRALAGDDISKGNLIVSASFNF